MIFEREREYQDGEISLRICNAIVRRMRFRCYSSFDAKLWKNTKSVFDGRHSIAQHLGHAWGVAACVVERALLSEAPRVRGKIEQHLERVCTLSWISMKINEGIILGITFNHGGATAMSVLMSGKLPTRMVSSIVLVVSNSSSTSPSMLDTNS
jgi:hypothetical protein